MFELTPLTLAELLVNLDWLGATPTSPVRSSKMNRRQAFAADFQGVPFETFIVCDNYFQGYLQTQQHYLLDEIGRVVYQAAKLKFQPWQRIAIFYWVIALKDLFGRQFPEFSNRQDPPLRKSVRYNSVNGRAVDERSNPRPH